MVHVKKWLSAASITLAAASLSLPAAADEEAGKIAKWILQLSLPAYELPAESVVVSKFVIIGKVSKSGDVTIYPLETAALNAVSYLRAVDQKAFELNKSVNARPWLEIVAAPTDANQAFANAFTIADADVAIIAPKQGVGKWQVVAYKKDKRQSLFATKFDKAPDAVAVVNWLFERLGYDGSILAKQGKYLLLGTLQSKLTENAKAFIVAESAGKISLKGDKSAKLPARIVKVFEHYAILEFNDANAEQPFELVGSKVVIKE